MAKLTQERIVEAGKVAGLTILDAGFDATVHTGELIQNSINYFSKIWKDNKTKVQVLKEMKEFVALKEKKQVLKDIPVEPKDYSPEQQARINEAYIQTYMDKMS